MVLIKIYFFPKGFIVYVNENRVVAMQYGGFSQMMFMKGLLMSNVYPLYSTAVSRYGKRIWNFFRGQ